MPSNRKPNWSKWRYIPEVKIWQAAALSLDIDPDKVKFSPRGWMVDSDRHVFDESQDFQDRVEVITSNAGRHPSLVVRSLSMSNPEDTKIELRLFSAFAKFTHWSLPSEFPVSIDKAFWLAKDLWSESEFQDLLCGLPPDGARESIKETNEAIESIQRAVIAGALSGHEPADATLADNLFHRNRFFKPTDAITWALTKSRLFPKFPFTAADVSGSVAAERSIQTANTQPKPPASDDLSEPKSLGKRERDSLLIIIASVARATKMDLSQPSKAAATIEALSVQLGARVAARTIEEHLKRIPEALERRGKESP